MHSKGCHFDWSVAKWRNLVNWDFSTSLHCARNDKILGNDNLYPKFRCSAIRIEKIDQKKQDPRIRNQDKMLNFEWFFTVQQLLNLELLNFKRYCPPGHFDTISSKSLSDLNSILKLKVSKLESRKVRDNTQEPGVRVKMLSFERKRCHLDLVERSF